MANEFKLYGPIQIEASKVGARLFRNHVGTGFQLIGQPPPGWRPPEWLGRFTFGLAPGSGDLVGWAPVTITPDMVGKTVAVFASVEVKDPAWRRTPAYEKGQQMLWANAVKSSGGIAGLAQSVDQAVAILAGR